MCEVKTINLGDRVIKVADLKQKYIMNIIDAAGKCDIIDRVVLFGSSIEERCKETSDIDLAVFGAQSKSKALSSRKYERFARQLYAFDNHNQAYDILYFRNGSRNNSNILDDIEKGEVIYERKQ